MTYTVLGSDDEALRITVTDGLSYSISVVDNDTEFGTTILDDAQNNLTIVTLATSSAYTDQDARDSISAGGNLSYNSTTGVMSYTQPTAVSTFTNDADYATETYVQTQVNNLIDGAPGALDTLNELAAAINDDADAFNTLNDLITANATNIALKFNSADFNTTFDTRLATKSTSDVAEGSNLYYTTTRANTDFDTRLATKSTTNLSEGSNLYHTTSRVQAVIDTNSAGFITDYTVTESDVTTHQAALTITESQITDLQSYITDYTVTESDVTDHEAALTITESQISDLDKYTDADFDTRLATKTTSDVAEGTNLYYTNARADARAQLKIDALVDSAPAALDTLNELAAALGDDANFSTTVTNSIATKLATADFDSTFDTRLATKDTGDVTEGSNLYYTDGRFDARLATKDTDDVSEGASNLYYTTGRHNTDFDTKLAAADTGDLTEGSNLYYTDARANSAIDTRVTGSFIDALDTVSDGGSY